ncbi:hypothetical protein M3Y94_00048000 [Aphelenchoides besseyi]|nr:hypothetical protein M3Y94_00048000 [Aphelenchoides besseyi]KAI6217016.1 hypothetical protein M3Y95_01245800 [Aphelenchoides besseyi]
MRKPQDYTTTIQTSQTSTTINQTSPSPTITTKTSTSPTTTNRTSPSPITSISTTTVLPDSLNIPTPAPLLSNASAGQSSAYKSLVQLIFDELDVSVSPCDLFENYTCKYAKSSFFAEASNNVYEVFKKGIASPEPSWGPTAKIHKYYKNCLAFFNKTCIERRVVWKEAMDQITSEIYDWKFVYANSTEWPTLTSESIGKFAGMLYRDYATKFPFSLGFRRGPNNETIIVLDFAGNDFEYMTRVIFGFVEEFSGKPLPDNVASYLNQSLPSLSVIPENLGKLELNSLETVSSVMSNFDIKTYLRTIFKYEPSVLQLLNSADSPMMIEWRPSVLLEFNQKFGEAFGNKNLSLLYNQAFNSYFYVNVYKFAGEDAVIRCASTNFLQMPSIRWFVDKVYEDEEERLYSEKALNEITAGIHDSLRSMLESVSWLNAESQRRVLKKVDAFKYHLSYPHQIFNETLLDEIDKRVDTFSDSYLEALHKTAQAEIRMRVDGTHDQINCTHALCKLGAVIEVNAEYTPNDHAMNIPLGIQLHPFFNDDYPIAAKYAILGWVVGHEMGHAFDSTCYLKDEFNQDNPVLVGSSLKAMLGEIQCLVNQYNDIRDEQGNPVDGKQTSGENFADNIGIPVAFRAFKQHESMHGVDPRLNDKLLKQLDGDQLFFFLAARLWCTTRGRTNSPDPHAPAWARVKGTLSNFPAFKAAFNCPVGSKYAPKTPCHIWATDPKAVSNL